MFALTDRLLAARSNIWEEGTAIPILRLWDLETGKPLRDIRLAVEYDTCNEIAFSPDGKLLAMRRKDAVYLFDPASGKLVRKIGSGINPRLAPARFEGNDVVRAAAFSPDGRSLVSGAEDGRLAIWDVATGKEIRRFGPVARCAIAVFSPDSRTLAVWSSPDRYHLKLFDAASGKELPPLPDHEQHLQAAFAPDSKTLASWGRDGVLRIWEVATGKAMGDVEGWGHVAFTSQGNTFVTMAARTIRLYEAGSGKFKGALSDKPIHADVLTLSPDGRYARTAFAGKAQLWDLQADKQVASWERGSWVPYIFSADSKQVLLFNRDNRDAPIRWWDIAKGEERPGNGMSSHGIFPSTALPGGKQLLTCRNGKLYFNDVNTGKEIRQIDLGKGMDGERGREGVVSPDGRLFLVTTADAQLRLWDLTSGKQLPVPQPEDGPLSNRTGDFAISHDNRWGAVCCGQRVLVIALPELAPAKDKP